jgi:DNA-binding transcriptional LysR family regulator
MRSKGETVAQRVDLNLLVIFDAIYKARNLTAAGRGLGLSQPAMSHALGRLRSTFNDPLFVRLSRGLQPTPLAVEIAPSLVQGLAAIRGSLERKPFDPSASARIFRIAQGDIAEAAHLPRLLREVRKTAPAIRFQTLEIPGPRLSYALGDGEVDIATGVDYELGAGCRQAQLAESEYACVMRADHPTIHSRLTLKQFRNAEHILVNPRGAVHHGAVIERALSRREVSARIAVEISHFNGVAALVTSSDLIATVPSRLAETMRKFANIKVFPPPIALPKVTVSLYWHERFHREPGNVWLRSVYLSLFQGREAAMALRTNFST